MLWHYSAHDVFLLMDFLLKHLSVWGSYSQPWFWCLGNQMVAYTCYCQIPFPWKATMAQASCGLTRRPFIQHSLGWGKMSPNKELIDWSLNNAWLPHLAIQMPFKSAQHQWFKKTILKGTNNLCEMTLVLSDEVHTRGPNEILLWLILHPAGNNMQTVQSLSDPTCP